MEILSKAWDWLKEGFAEKRTTIPGFIVLILYMAGVVTAEQYAFINQILESFGLVIPVVGAALVAVPSKRILGK